MASSPRALPAQVAALADPSVSDDVVHRAAVALKNGVLAQVPQAAEHATLLRTRLKRSARARGTGGRTPGVARHRKENCNTHSFVLPSLHLFYPIYVRTTGAEFVLASLCLYYQVCCSPLIRLICLTARENSLILPKLTQHSYFG